MTCGVFLDLSSIEAKLFGPPHSAARTACPAIGIGYRTVIDDWTRDNFSRASISSRSPWIIACSAARRLRTAIYDLVGRIPLTAHGIGLSIGTDEPLDLAYLDQVARVVEQLNAPNYSEHLAFTRVGERDLSRLLPLPKTEEVAELIILKVRTVQSRVPVPFLLENIAYVFDWPERELSDVEFLTLICRETGAGILLDVENLYLNGRNHGVDPYAFIDALPTGAVREVHIAGGETVSENWEDGDFLSDSHNRPMPGRSARPARLCARTPRTRSHRARAGRSHRGGG